MAKGWHGVQGRADVPPVVPIVAGSDNAPGPGERRRAVEGLVVPIVAALVSIAAVPIMPVFPPGPTRHCGSLPGPYRRRCFVGNCPSRPPCP